MTSSSLDKPRAVKEKRSEANVKRRTKKWMSIPQVLCIYIPTLLVILRVNRGGIRGAQARVTRSTVPENMALPDDKGPGTRPSSGP